MHRGELRDAQGRPPSPGGGGDAGSDPARTRRLHWEDVHTKTGATSVSWYQSVPTISLELVEAAGLPRSAAVIDVGGGASRLVDELLAGGYEDVTVLDVSSTVLEIARERVGSSSRARWMCQDVLSWTPDRRYDLWHDRAVFHFLVDGSDRESYLATLGAALRPGGFVIMATFAAGGPRSCSGLPVASYDPEELSQVLGDGFETLSVRVEEHRTPAGTAQPFGWILARAVIPTGDLPSHAGAP